MANNNRLGAIWCQLTRSTRYARYVEEEDRKSFLRRYNAEGIQFPARDLATLRVALLAGLETGWLKLPLGHRFGAKGHGILPRFLYKAWAAVFTKDGMLRPDYDVGAIDCLNQLTAVFGKIAGGHTPASEQAVIDSFISVEEELQSIPFDQFTDCCWANGIPTRNLLERARKLIAHVLAGLDPGNITPKHGSGASACGTPFHKRFAKPRYISKIDRIWPYSSFWYSGINHLVDECHELATGISDDDYVPRAKVLLVPKDSRGPRLISCEPRETMWIQQGLMTALVQRMESHRLTRGWINFTRQDINNTLAKAGSIWCPSLGFNRNYATLDLKDASDRVTCDLVNAIFPENWATALMACRSTSTMLPDGRVIEMSKHAPMGSATCFPVMALCIWAIAKASLPHIATNSSQRRKDPRVEEDMSKAVLDSQENVFIEGAITHDEVVKFSHEKLCGRPDADYGVYVYGDDVIVQREFANRVVAALEAVKLRVNRNKSFIHGSFRESCGGEYVDGIDVTPVRMRNMPDDTFEAQVSYISFVNNMTQKLGVEETVGLRAFAHEWYSEVPEINISDATNIIMHEDSFVCAPPVYNNMLAALAGVLFTEVPNNSRLRKRWNSDLQRTEYRYRVAVPVRIKYPTDDWSHVLRSLVQPKGTVLGQDALAKRIRFKYGWRHWGEV